MASVSLRWRRRSSAAAAFSGIEVVIASSTSAQVSWFVSPNAQGQVQWGTSPGSYPNATTLEAGLLGYHSQTVSGLSAGVPVFARIMAITPGPVVTYSDEFTFTTEAAPSGAFDSGYTYTDVPWPTGTGWTAGALSTIRANINALIASSGNGADATHHVRHLPAPGAEYPVDTYIDILGRQHLTFEGGGTEVTSEPWGHAGGAICSTTAVTGLTSRQAVFTGGTGTAAQVTFEDIRWHCLTIKGSMVNMATASAASSNGTESQYGIGSFGADDGLVDHCRILNLADCIEIQQSTGTSGAASHPSTGWEIRYNDLGPVARMVLAQQSGSDIWYHHNYLRDPAYSYFDEEPDAAYQTNADVTFEDSVLAGSWNWQRTGGPEGLGYAMPAMTITVPGSAQPNHNGYLRFRRNRLDGMPSSPNYLSSSRQFLTINAFTRVNVNGEVTIEDNTTGGTRAANPQPGPIVTIRYAINGPITVTGNTGFKNATGSWLSISNSAAVTQSGNT